MSVCSHLFVHILVYSLYLLQMCQSHCQVSTDIAGHYKAVCRAVFAEAMELSTFLEKISADKVVRPASQFHPVFHSFVYEYDWL